MGHRGCVLDLMGQRFGRLLVLSHAGTNKHRNMRWECLCDCHNLKVVSSSALRPGHVRSCGCLPRGLLSRRTLKHGQRRKDGHSSPTYYSWQAMIARCLNKHHHAYDRYGGRGITICGRWLGENGFINFLTDMKERPRGKTLDRINNDLGYVCGRCQECIRVKRKANCRWATKKEQRNNRRPFKKWLLKIPRQRPQIVAA